MWRFQVQHLSPVTCGNSPKLLRGHCRQQAESGLSEFPGIMAALMHCWQEFQWVHDSTAGPGIFPGQSDFGELLRHPEPHRGVEIQADMAAEHFDVVYVVTLALL